MALLHNYNYKFQKKIGATAINGTVHAIAINEIAIAILDGTACREYY